MIFAKILSKYLFYLSALLLVPLALASYYQSCAISFLITLLITLTLATVLWYWGRKATGALYARESIILVVLIWIVTSILSSLPFSLSGTLKPIDAYFEAMSGLTTTGSTMICPKTYDPATGEEVPIHLTNAHVPEKTYVYYGTVAPIRDPETGLILHTGIEAVSRALLFWRCLLQWVGGMGIVVIFLAVLPALGVGGKFLYQMEATGPFKDEISPRVHDTASRLWKLYLFFTLTEIALLVWTNGQMPFFDALCISLSNVSTGGFSVRNDSIASYHSAATEWIVFAFMIVGSINFSLYFHALRFKFFRIYVPDFFLFLSIAALGCITVSCFLIEELGVAQAFAKGSFQALSMQTTTGFFTANYDIWPFKPQMFMLILMFVGGMSSSTASGIKTSRFYIAYKILLHRLESIFRPDSVRKLRIGKNEVDDKNALTVLAFFCIVIFFSVLGTLSFVLDGVDPETAFGLAASLLNNVGIAFRAAGPTESLCFLSPFSKILATFWMLLGRLEFFVVLLLFFALFLEEPIMYLLFRVLESVSAEEIQKELVKKGLQHPFVIEDDASGEIFVGGHSKKPIETSNAILVEQKEAKVDWKEQWSLFAENFTEGKAHIQLGEKTLLLLPGAGFGDLSHPTTYLMLELLKTRAANESIVDIGTGSGILALSALALGATSAIGIDIDPDALIHAKENAKINHLPARFSKRLPKTLGKDNLFLMNMILPEQQQANPRQYNPLAKLWLTSGILIEQKEQYYALVQKWGWTLETEVHKGPWCAFVFRPAAT